jgi:ribose transport system substrate-binding protein
MFRTICAATAIAAGGLLSIGAAHSQDYPAPKPLKTESQAPIKGFGGSKGAKIAYMPPATEFNYYIAIGEGVKDEAAKHGITTFMLAPQSGADINGQMGMIQDVINQKVAAIILSTHDEHAAAPLVKQAVAQGIAVIIVNSDIASFPAPVHAVVGYSQRSGTHKEGEYALKLAGDKAMAVGIRGNPAITQPSESADFSTRSKDRSLRSPPASTANGMWKAATPPQWTCCKHIPTFR